MKINVCFGINNDHAQHCAVSMASILSNSNIKDKYTFYIITDFISSENKAKLNKLKEIRPFNLKFVKVNVLDYKGMKKFRNGHSAYYRLKSFDINEEKILYLDADTVCRDDVGELFATDIKEYLCAGVEDICNHPLTKEKRNIDPSATYINSGVILFNLDLCRKEGIKQKMLAHLKTPDAQQFFDQEAINYIFQNRIKILDLKWNHAYRFKNYYEDKDYYEELKETASIIHFLSDYKPWLPQYKDTHRKEEYFKYIRLTPYYSEFIDRYRQEEIVIELQGIKKLLEEMKPKEENKN